MSLQPHKEERFLFTAYPLMLASAAVCFDDLFFIISAPLQARSPALHSMMHIIFSLSLSLSLALSVSRSASIVMGFSAPFHIWSQISRDAALHRVRSGLLSAPVTVCAGKEWYR